MYAFIIAKITDGDKVRILDLSPSATVRVFDRPLKEIEMAILDGKIELQGIDASKGYLCYHENNIQECVPVLKNENSNSSKKFLVSIVYSGNGKYEAVISNAKGSLTKVDLASMSKELLDSLVNIKRQEVYGDIDVLPCVKYNNDYGYLIYYPNNTLFDVLGTEKLNPIEPDDHWLTLNEFKFNCLLKKITFEIEQDAYFRYVSDIDEKLVIPKGILSIDNISGFNALKNLKELWIPDTVYNFNLGDLSNAENLDEIHFENEDIVQEIVVWNLSNSDSFFRHLPDFDVKKLIPKNVTRLYGLTLNSTGYNEVSPKNINALVDLTYLEHLDTLTNSIRSSDLREYTGDIVFPKSLKMIKDSYNNDKFNPAATVRIPSSVEVIDMSFNSCNCNVDFSQASSLTRIDNSAFGDLECEVLDLSNCVNLKTIGCDCFRHCHNLKEVILPDSLEYIGVMSFSDCPLLNKVNIPLNCKKLDHSTFADSNIKSLDIYGSTIVNSKLKDAEVIFHDLYKSNFHQANTAGNTKVIFPENLKSIGASGLANTNLDNIKFNSLPEKLDAYCFEYCEAKVFDIYDWPVADIPAYAFSYAKIHTLALPLTTKKIGAECFKSVRIKKLFIPDSVEFFDNKAMDSMAGMDNSLIEFYVVKGSTAEKHLRKYKQQLNSYDTNQEAYEACIGLDVASSIRSQMKAKMLMSNSKDPNLVALTSPEYVKNIDILMKLYKRTKEESFKSDYNVKIYDNKLKVICNAEKMQQWLKSNNLLGGDEQIVAKRCPNPNLLSNRFKVVVNLLTSGTEQSSFSINETAFMDLLNKLVDAENFSLKTIIKEEYGGVYVFNIPVKDNTIHLYVIVIGTNIVYVTSTYLASNNLDKSREQFYTMFTSHVVLEQFNYDEDFKFIMCDFIKPNDILAFRIEHLKGMKIASVEMPTFLSKIIYSETSEQYFPIKFNRATKNGNGMLINLADFTVMMSNLVFNSEDTRNINYKNLKYVDIVKKTDINSLSQKEFEKIAKQLFLDSADILINQTFYTNEFIDMLKQSEDAYDEVEPIFEWEFSKQIQELKLSKLEDLHSKAVELLFKTSFFNLVNKNYNELDFYTTVTDLTLPDGCILITKKINNQRKLYHPIIGIDHNYISYIINPRMATPEIVECALSANTPKKIFSILNSFYNPNTQPQNIIDNKLHSIDDYVIIYSMSAAETSIRVSLGINRGDGQVYLLAVKGRNVITLIRLKGMAETFEVMKVMYTASRNRYLSDSTIIIGFMFSTAQMLHGETFNKRRNPFNEVRDLILNGYPNGYDYAKGSPGLDIYKLAAKQRK